ncbi:hypothetical protein OF001_U360020 [Pseudomonas sp. OF001]|nr:hypothetical protein OF001_U360020 [Pseudomonas sp. OF001]
MRRHKRLPIQKTLQSFLTGANPFTYSVTRLHA